MVEKAIPYIGNSFKYLSIINRGMRKRTKEEIETIRKLRKDFEKYILEIEKLRRGDEK